MNQAGFNSEFELPQGVKPNSNFLTTVQYAKFVDLISEGEIEKITSFLRSQGNPDYIEEITKIQENIIGNGDTNDGQDELYQTALKIIKTEKKASTSFLQRKLQIGYNRAARIIDQMETKGIVSKANHTGKREVL